MKEARKNRRRWVAALVFCAASATALGAVRVHHRQSALRLGYALSAATDTLRQVREENRRLRLERSVLTSPERIERLAAALGLATPAPENVRIIDPGEALP